ncbi:unnamed protein product [Tilletia controversa]|nr:hypothetical protein CF328_g5182 [Tilletia controversa]CAD6974213.1 unnamed protein product [Tilletia controversa]
MRAGTRWKEEMFGEVDGKVNDPSNDDVATHQMSAPPARGPTRPPPTLFTLALLVPASMLGTLTRIGITNLFTFSGTPLAPPIIWAQIVGCAVFGGALQNKEYFEAVVLRLDHHPTAVGLQLGSALYIALTSGYCGSVTTFSTWILDDYLAWANYDGAARTGGKSFLAGVGQTFVTLAMSAASLRVGMKLAEEGEPFCMARLVDFLPASLRVQSSSSTASPASIVEPGPGIAHAVDDADDLADFSNRKKNTEPFAGHHVLYVLTSLFAIGLLLMTSLLTAFYSPTRSISVALALSPPGAMLRWFLSRFNGKQLRSSGSRGGWPYGTFAANMMGISIVAASYTALHASRSADAASTLPYSRVTCDVIYDGLETGLAGALSTISTFIAELYTLGAGLKTRRAAIFYAFASWGFGMVACVLFIAVPLAALHRVDRCSAYSRP